MAEKVVQDSDDEELESLEDSPKGPVAAFDGNKASQSWVRQSHENSQGKSMSELVYMRYRKY